MFIVMSTMFCGHLGVKELHAIALANAVRITALFKENEHFLQRQNPILLFLNPIFLII